MTTEEIIEVTRESLRAWPLFKEDHDVRCREIGDNRFWIGYRTAVDLPLRSTTHFNVNVICGIFYLLDIEIQEKSRGKGHGNHLYVICEDLAAKLGCTEIRQTPSGWANGETRLEYLMRRGWKEDGNEVFKAIALSS